MASASTAKALADLTDRVDRTPGWSVLRQRKGSGVTIHAPGGGTARYNLSGSGGCKLANVQAQLKRIGWDADAADRAREREAKKQLAAERERAESAVAQAQIAGQRRAHAESLTKARAHLSQTETELRRVRAEFERAEDSHRQALAAVENLERNTQ